MKDAFGSILKINFIFETNQYSYTLLKSISSLQVSYPPIYFPQFQLFITWIKSLSHLNKIMKNINSNPKTLINS